MLYDSLEKNEKRGIAFSKIDGKATSLYYYIDGISSVISGFLFAINGYLPLIFCLLIAIVSVIMSMNFEEIDNTKEREKVKITKEFSNLRKSLKSIFGSPRLRNLLVFGTVFSGILSVLVTLRSSILSDIGVSSQYFGIIFAILGIVSGISAKEQYKIHSKFRNKTLASLTYMTTLVVVLAIFVVQYIAKGPFYTLIRQYLNNFTTASLRNKISSSYNMLESFFRFSISLFASFLLRYTTTANTLTIIGCIATVVIVLMLDNMRTKVGLKPEEYKEKDTKILELK